MNLHGMNADDDEGGIEEVLQAVSRKEDDLFAEPEVLSLARGIAYLQEQEIRDAVDAALDVLSESRPSDHAPSVPDNYLQYFFDRPVIEDEIEKSKRGDGIFRLG